MIIDKALSKVFGTKHERDVKAMRPRVAAIGELEAGIKPLSDDAIRARVAEIRARVQDALKVLPENIEERRSLAREVLNKELVETFALVREAAWRAIGQRHYDVQLIGGMVLHEGKIAEMRTGEGKTLVATLAVYLNALSGRGVHVVTVNDYLARRDAEWMGRIYQFLGLTVGCIQHDMPDEDRRAAYRCDITYGTNNEFGFDYLRDNMKFELAQMVQRGHVFAIVDEVDSILIDEARTPLIISGPSEGETDIYYKVDRIIPKLVRGEEVKDKYGNKTTTGDFLVDEKAHTSSLTEEGVAKCERLLGVENLYDPVNIDILHACQQALRAHTLYKRDVDYVVKDGQVIIVDEFTGRLMPGRRWSDGLHQAVEAKEGVKIEKENQTLATITFQNYFRMYDKLSGMTGTADTEAAEFDKIYKLDVVVIPTNRDMIRIDEHDLVYRTEREKFEAVVEEIAEKQREGPARPRRHDLDREVRASLDDAQEEEGPARRPEREVPRAGGDDRRAGGPGRGGHDRDEHGRPRHGHPPRRQPRVPRAPESEGRRGAVRRRSSPSSRRRRAEAHEQVVGAGRPPHHRHRAPRVAPHRQPAPRPRGPPGRPRLLAFLPLARGRPHADLRVRPAVGPHEAARAWKRASRSSTGGSRSRSSGRRRQVEGRNFDTRKHLLEYDDVMNKQREEIYRLRKEILTGKLSREYVVALAEDVSEDYVDRHCPAAKDPSEWNWDALEALVFETYGFKPSEKGLSTRDSNVELKDKLRSAVRETYEAKEKSVGPEVLRDFEKFVMLQTVDTLWKDHLLGLDHLKEGIGLRGYGQRDPLVEYKKESFQLFEAMKEGIEEQILQYLFRFEVQQAPVERASRQEVAVEVPAGEAATAASVGSSSSRRAAAELEKKARHKEKDLNYQGTYDPTSGGDFEVSTVKAAGPKVGRNDPCPCGSGKKYKKCHGAHAPEPAAPVR